MIPLLLFLAVALTACAGETIERPTIGVVVSNSASNAAIIAAETANRDAGPGDSIFIHIAALNQPLSAEPAIEIAGALVDNPDIIAVVGHANSAASLAAAQIYNDAGTVQIAPTSTAPAFSKAGPYSFRMVPDDRQQAAFLVGLMRADTALRRIAIGYTNDDYGRGLYALVSELLTGGRPEIVTENAHLVGGDSVRLAAFAERATKARAQLLLWLGRPPALRKLLASGRLGMPVLGSDGLESGAIYTNENSIFTGVAFVRFLDPDMTRAGLAEFARTFSTRAQAPITAEAVYTYDAVMLIAEGVRAGARSREAMLRFVNETGSRRPAFQGLGGPVAFDEDGDVERSYSVATVTNSGVRSVSALPPPALR